MANQYEETTLKRLQSVEKSILDDFSKVCEELGVRYFGIAGTALGAIRHQGFIPWDDDIDVGMLREDFEYFQEKAPILMKEKYDLLYPEIYPEFPIPIIRICKRGTIFHDECFKDIDLPFGIYLDILPFDYVPDDEKKRKKMLVVGWIKEKFFIIKGTPKPTMHFKGTKEIILDLGCRMFHWLMKILHISNRFVYKSLKKYITKYSARKTETIACFAATYPWKTVMKLEDIFPTKTVKFDETVVVIPNNADKHLKNLYGDYMVQPPVDARINHFPYKLDFGDKE